MRKARQRILQDRKKRPGFAGSVGIRYGRDPCLRKHSAKNSMVREMALSGVIADGSRCIENKTTAKSRTVAASATDGCQRVGCSRASLGAHNQSSLFREGED